MDNLNYLRQKNYLLKSLFFLLIFLLIYKGFKNPITYDEAQTYIDYVQPKDIYKFAIANNHPLNSILMIVSTYFGSSVIYLRIPNILVGILFLIVSYLISKKSIFPEITFLTLTFTPYLFEFFTLARGYGLAAGLIFFGTINYFYRKWNKYSILISSLLFFFAIYSIFPSSVYVFSFFAVVTYNEVKKKNYMIFFFSSLIVGFASYQTLRWMMTITKYDLYIPGPKNVDIKYLISNSFGFGPLFNPYNPIIGSVIFYFFIFLCLFFYFKYEKAENFNLELIFLLTVSLLYIIPIIMGTNIPVYRVLLPFFPPLLLIISSNIERLLASIKSRIANLISIVISLILIVNFFNNFKLENTYDFAPNKLEKKEATVYLYNEEEGSCYYPKIDSNPPVAQYYRDQAFKNNEPYCDEGSGNVLNYKQ